MWVSSLSIPGGFKELGEGYGPTGPVALRVVDSDPVELLQSDLVLDAFGNRFDLELARYTNDGLDDLQVFLVAEQVPHELHIYLEIVDGQVPEVGERPVADAEVIEGDRTTMLAQTHREGPRRVEIIRDRGLGDLEHEVFRSHDFIDPLIA
jgi:hypothetical protein